MGYGRRHVGHAVVEHSIHAINGITESRRPGGFDATPLIDRHIHDDRSSLHPPDHLGRDQAGGRSPGNQHRADEQVGAADRL